MNVEYFGLVGKRNNFADSEIGIMFLLSSKSKPF